MKGLIIYKGKYGATGDYAALLSKELDLPVFTPTVISRQLMEADYVLIGSAVYIGKLSLQSWLTRHQEWLRTKKLFFFIVCGTPANDKDKTDRIVTDNIPRSLRNHPVFFLKGRMIRRNLQWTDRLLLKMGSLLTRDPAEKKNMLQDFDGVDATQLQPLVEAVRLWEQQQQEELQLFIEI